MIKVFAIRLMTDDSGQDLIEYALLAGFISLVAVAAITSVGTGVNNVYDEIDQHSWRRLVVASISCRGNA